MNMLFNIISYVLIVFTFYKIYKTGFSAGIKAQNEYLLSCAEDLKRNAASNLVRVVLEKSDDQYLVYNKETSVYLTKGKSMSEINKKLEEMNSTKTYWVHPDDIKEEDL